MPAAPKVVIVGGGFGGLYAALALRRAPVEVSLVDRQNYHLFQPLLYQVATGGLSPADIASPLRFVLRKQPNTTVLLEEVIDIRTDDRIVVLRDRELEYDYLIVAAGARSNYFGNTHWQTHAPSLKGLEDATEIRRRVLWAFEAAELADDPAVRDRYLTFVVAGAGPTGVELAGAIAEVARDTLPKDFRKIDTSKARIILVEGGDRVLPALSARLSAAAASSLEQLGVEVLTRSMVREITAESVTVESDGQAQTIATATTLWAAGIRPSPLAERLAAATGVETDAAGRVVVRQDCTIDGHPEIFVVGDMARYETDDGKVLPGVAPVAMQQGRYVAKHIRQRVQGREPAKFRYRDKGDLATIGRSAAVARVGTFEFTGYPAWLAWLFVHLIYLAEFQNRLLVFLQWGWRYVTWNRSARLISPSKVEETEPG